MSSLFRSLADRYAAVTASGMNEEEQQFTDEVEFNHLRALVGLGPLPSVLSPETDSLAEILQTEMVLLQQYYSSGRCDLVMSVLWYHCVVCTRLVL